MLKPLIGRDDDLPPHRTLFGPGLKRLSARRNSFTARLLVALHKEKGGGKCGERVPGPRATVTLSAVKHGETPLLWNRIKEEGQEGAGEEHQV